MAVGAKTYEYLLDSIVTAITIVTFKAEADRMDMINGMGKFRFSGLAVRRRSDLKLIKSFTFNHGYFGTASDNKRLRLNGLTVKGNDDLTPVENYSFDYEAGLGELPPYPENIWGNGTYKFHEDYWGYYNGTSSNSQVPMQFTPTYVPTERASPGYLVPVGSSSSTNRNPDSSFAKVALLKHIVYPKGGKQSLPLSRTVNAYSYAAGWAVPDIVGGFRIRRIANYLADGTLAECKSYRYSLGHTQTIICQFAVP